METGSAKSFEDITEQDWPDGDLNPTAEGVERPAKKHRKINFLHVDSCGRLLHPGVDEKHPDPRNDHVVQTLADVSITASSGIGNNVFFFLPVLEPVSKSTQHIETTEPRAKQPRIEERVYPSPLPMPIPCIPLSQHIDETVRQFGESVEDPEEDEEQMMLVTTVVPGPRSEGCLLAGAPREMSSIFPRVVHSHVSRTHCTRGQD